MFRVFFAFILLGVANSSAIVGKTVALCDLLLSWRASSALHFRTISIVNLCTCALILGGEYDVIFRLALIICALP